MNKISVTIEKADGKWNVAVERDSKHALSASDVGNLWSAKMFVNTILDQAASEEDELKRRMAEAERRAKHNWFDNPVPYYYEPCCGVPEASSDK